MNNDLLGMLIPLLMQGASIGDILRALGGQQFGASGMDGLTAVLAEQAGMARRAHRHVPDQGLVDRAAETLVDKLGVVPTSGLGQGMASLFGSLYHAAPDTFGAILGVPNTSQFFSTIANGAAGISAAGGVGVDMFNPYSVMESHRQAIEMAQKVYKYSTKEGGGYNIDFSHGLNMGEVGKVTQRLLSSDLAYRDDKGNRFDLSRDVKGNIINSDEAQRFDDRIKDLGEKFNEAASMLAKVTGSVDEALNVMDRLGGGNFLGGTAEQAKDVAKKAKNMAAAIRVTSAMAGISPQEAYAQMKGLQGGMARGMGLNPYIAAASGMEAAMGNMAYVGMMGYNMWAAMNPDATQAQKNQAQLGANGRAQAYATSTGSRLAAAVAANSSLFSEEELRQLETAFREGRPDDMMDLARERIGHRRLGEMMSDPALIAATRMKATKENPELLNRIDAAGIEGNLPEAESYGSRMLLKQAMSDLDVDLMRVTGRGEFGSEREEARKTYLKGLAKKHLGLSDIGMQNISLYDLEKMLREAPGLTAEEIERGANNAEIEKAKEQLILNTMSRDEEKEARERLYRYAENRGSYTKEGLEKLHNRLFGKGDTGLYKESIESISEFMKNVAPDRDEKDEIDRLRGNKMSYRKYEQEMERLSGLEKTQKTEYTTEERLRKIENDVKWTNAVDAGNMKNVIAGKDFKNAKSDVDALNELSLEASRKGINFGEDVLRGATNRVVSNIFGGRLGKMKDDDLKDFNDRFSKGMMDLINKGTSIKDAFKIQMKGLSAEDRAKIGSEEEVEKLIEHFTGRADDEDFESQYLSRRAIGSAAASIVDSRTRNARLGAVKSMKDLVGDGSKELDEEAIAKFKRLARDAGIFKGSDDEFSALVEKSDKTAGSLLGLVSPRGTRDMSYEAAAAGANADNAMINYAAAQHYLSGGRMRPPGFDPDLISDLDDVEANRKMNALPNAMKGTAEFYREAIKDTEKRIGDIQGALKGFVGDKGETINQETLDTAFGENKKKYTPDAKGREEKAADDKRREEAQKLLKMATGENYTTLQALYESKGVGGMSGAALALGKKEDLKKAMGEKDAGNEVLNITREANKKDSDAYQILQVLSGIAKGIGIFMANPTDIFKGMPPIDVNVVNGQQLGN